MFNAKYGALGVERTVLGAEHGSAWGGDAKYGAQSL